MTAAEPYRLHASIGYQLTITARQQERRLEDKLKTLGLSRVAWCVLLAVGNEGLEQPSAIADFVGIDRTAASRALRGMESAGLIRRHARPGDRRTTSVRLTKKGQQHIAAATPFAIGNNATIEAALGRSDLAELRRILAKLRGIESAPLPGL